MNNINKVTLIFPPIPNGQWAWVIYPSMGMAYLDAVLRDKFDVTIVDSNLLHPTVEFYEEYNKLKYPARWKEIHPKILKKIIKITEKTQPDILGIGSWSFNMSFVAEFIREFKARNPEIPIILGGITPTHMPTEVLELLPYIDYIVRGEGEITIQELLEKLSRNESVNRVKGISFRNKEGKIVHTPDRSPIKKLDQLPFFDYENFLGFKKWNSPPKMHYLEVMASRGCTANCSFCTVAAFWGRQRFYSDEYVIKQIKHLLDLYDFIENKIAWMDDNFVIQFNKTKRLLKKAHIIFPEYAHQLVDMRIESIHAGCTPAEFLNFAKKVKVEFMGFGMESLNSNSLIFMNKTINLEKYKKIVYKLINLGEKYKIRIYLSGIIGLPNETKKDMIKQTNFYIDVFNNYKFGEFCAEPPCLHPGTKLWKEYLEGKIKVYRVLPESAKRWQESLFSEKYNHLIWMVPNAYRIANNKMNVEEFEYILYKIYRILIRLGNISREEKQPRFFVEKLDYNGDNLDKIFKESQSWPHYGFQKVMSEMKENS
jgi:radical SAM superfamily enzyme YgiQ (UPF0313 family)